MVTLCPPSTPLSCTGAPPVSISVEAPLSTPIPTSTAIISPEDFVTAVIFKQLQWLDKGLYCWKYTGLSSKHWSNLTYQSSDSQMISVISQISTHQSSPRIADMCQIEQSQVVDVKSAIFTSSPLDLSLARDCTELSVPPSLSTLVGCTIDTLALRAHCIASPSKLNLVQNHLVFLHLKTSTQHQYAREEIAKCIASESEGNTSPRI